MRKLNLLIVDDQNLFAKSLKIVFDAYPDDFDSIIVAENGYKAIDILKEASVDVILMDVWMPEIDGIKAVSMIRDFNKTTKIIMLSTYGYDKYVRSALKTGADAYLLKDISPDELISSIKRVFKGQKIISREILEHQEGNPDTKNQKLDYPKALDTLVQREKEILALIGKGYSNEEIADKLCLSEHTVRNYVSSINSKLETRNRFEAMRLAIEYNIGSLL